MADLSQKQSGAAILRQVANQLKRIKMALQAVEFITLVGRDFLLPFKAAYPFILNPARR
jgi:hypothetical protein